ncbi:hypothetical protein HYT52_01700 [Candidatus Woesearchaeota archaeon]|nr:hypothetical protein [Candidatus Woesearchaeota archaeon]
MTDDKGPLDIRHSIYCGGREIGLRVLGDYRIENDRDGNPILNTSFSRIYVERLENIDCDYAIKIIMLFSPEIERILWDKSVDRVFGKCQERKYTK